MKVGDYVRTKDGYIYKIEDGEEFYEDFVDVGIGTIPDVDGIWIDKEHFQYVDKREIVKSSPNIIDLIGCGDVLIVKEYCDEVCQMFTEIYLIQSDEQLLNIKEDLEKSKNHKLYSTVTKEQFEQISYKVRD